MQYHHLMATYFTNFSFGSYYSIFTFYSLCFIWRTYYGLLAFFQCRSFFTFFSAFFFFWISYDSSDSESSSDYSSDPELYETCFLLKISSLGLKSGQLLLILRQTLSNRSLESESSMSMVSGFQYFWRYQSLFLVSYQILRTQSSFLLRLSSFLSRTYSSFYLYSTYNLASSELSRHNLLVLRLVTTTYIHPYVPSLRCSFRDILFPNYNQAISKINIQIIHFIIHLIVDYWFYYKFRVLQFLMYFQGQIGSIHLLAALLLADILFLYLI